MYHSETDFLGDAGRRGVQLRGERLLLPDPGRPAEQRDEGGLEGVFRVGVVGQQATAHGPYESAMTGEEDGEGCFVPHAGEAREQVHVFGAMQRPFPGLVPEKAVDQVQHRGLHTKYVLADCGFLHCWWKKTKRSLG